MTSTAAEITRQSDAFMLEYKYVNFLLMNVENKQQTFSISLLSSVD